MDREMREVSSVDHQAGGRSDLLVWKVVPWESKDSGDHQTGGPKGLHDLLGVFRKGFGQWRGIYPREMQVQVLESVESFLLRFDLSELSEGVKKLDQHLGVALDGNELEVTVPRVNQPVESNETETHLFILPKSVALNEISAIFLEELQQLELRLPKTTERKIIKVVKVPYEEQENAEEVSEASRKVSSYDRYEMMDAEMAHYSLGSDYLFWSTLNRQAG